MSLFVFQMITSFQSVLDNGSRTVFTEVGHDDYSNDKLEADSISLWLCKEARKKKQKSMEVMNR